MRRIGRYQLSDVIASGGMGSVHLGRAEGARGFARIVAIKRLHPHLASAPESKEAFLDEARLSARVRHPNVVATLDVVADEIELLLVMDYVHGMSLVTLAKLAEANEAAIPIAVTAAIMVDLLAGLQAVHDATDERGAPLHMVHRDVSPQNVIVGADGSSRLLDFGIAKAAVRLQTTRDGSIKGKLRYMAPEQLLNREVGPTTDVFAAGITAWELLSGRPLFGGASEDEVIGRVLEGVILAPSLYRSDVPAEVDAVVVRALARDPSARFGTCREMAAALRSAIAPASADEVGLWVRNLAGDALREREKLVAAIESGVARGDRPAIDTQAVHTMTVASALPRSARRRGTFIAAGALSVFVVLGVAFAWTRLHAGANAVDVSSTPTDPDPSSSAVATSTAAATDAPPLDLDSPIATAQVSTPPSAVKIGHPATHGSARPRSGKCDPMFTIDADGIRRIKPGCL
ncbi:hypothetical protein BH09MYX1_BH09MYX1_26320 [soil metagenome]